MVIVKINSRMSYNGKCLRRNNNNDNKNKKNGEMKVKRKAKDEKEEKGGDGDGKKSVWDVFKKSMVVWCGGFFLDGYLFVWVCILNIWTCFSFINPFFLFFVSVCEGRNLRLWCELCTLLYICVYTYV